MEPLDREKPWNAFQQIALIAIVMGVVYLFVRFAVVVPEWGVRLVWGSTIVGVALYYFLAFRRGVTKAAGAPPPASTLHVVTVALLIVALTFPLFAALYVWMGGGPPWK